MQKSFLISLFLLLTLGLFAQPYGNEWINYSQKYFKFPITESGIYRISQAKLISAGVPVFSVSPQNFQIFARGEEQYIYIKGEDQGLLEYIEFYAEGNDGWLDTAMFENQAYHTNPHYSLINDTIYYFLTWNNLFNNRRLTIESDNNFNNYTPASYCMKEVFSQFTDQYYDGLVNPKYTQAEGWFGGRFSPNGALNYLLETPNYYQNGIPSIGEVSFAGVSNAASSAGANHHVKVQFLDLTIDTAFYGYKTIKKTLSSNAIVGNTTTFSFNAINDISATTDYNSVAYISLKYPHTFQFENKNTFQFSLPDESQTKTLLSISEFDAGTEAPVLYDLTNHRRITVVIENNLFKALIPEIAGSQSCIISSVSAIKSVTKIKKASSIQNNGIFNNLLVDFGKSDFIIITHPKLWSASQTYQNYKNTKGFATALINIEELYDQFSYGINKHPLAIQNFVRYMQNSGTIQPKYLFLIGKSIHVSGSQVWQCHRKDSANYANCLVPSIGDPTSDNLLSCNINHSNIYDSFVPTGRLSAQNEQDVLNYLNKLQEHDLVETVPWKKEILHFGGGATTNEQLAFKTYLNNYKAIIEDTLFGGHVNSYFKNSSLPIQITQSDSIRSLINNGVAIMTFFGHGTSAGFDQDIDYAAGYLNQGKYPFILANSCYSGDIHLPYTISKSEEWVMTPSKGAIAFLASSGLSISTNLNQYSERLYQQIASLNYGGSIGNSIKNTMQLLIPFSSIQTSVLEFTLHGDPSVSISASSLPDLTLNETSIVVNPHIITTGIDSFKVEVIVSNIGRSVNEPFIIELQRIFSNNETVTYTKILNSCYYKDTVEFTLPVDIAKGPGYNKLIAKADALQFITEASELNNTAFITFVIESDDITPIFPYKYAIYPNNTVTLKASTGNILASIENYVFQVDTNDIFSQPLYSTTIAHAGGVVTCPLPITLTDSTVYYWRVSKDSLSSGNYKWKESSFIYIPTKTGWSQAHFFQFKNDGYNFIDYNRPDRKYDFITSPKQLHCHVQGSVGTTTAYYVNYEIDGSGDWGVCGGASAIIVVDINPSTLMSKDASDTCYSRNRPDKFLTFYSNATDRIKLKNYLNDSVPNGHYLLIYTYNNGDFENWDESTYVTFEMLGATAVRTNINSHPYILFAKKGDLASAQEKVGDSPTAIIDLYANLNTNFPYGDITSELIGPSSNWQTLHWRYKALGDSTGDEQKVDLFGIKQNGDQQLLLNLTNTQLDYYNLNDIANPSLYPYLKMQFTTRDEVNKTPSQINRWQVTYDGLPETALNPSKGFFFSKDTVQEGENIIFSMATENISSYNMDSLMIKYWVQDKNNVLHTLEIHKKRPHPAGDVLIDTIYFSSTGYAGLNSLWIEVNPINAQTGHYDQLEQYHFNNIAQKFFFVKADKTNPMLDITFDGIHILDGDIISAKPEIVIQLKDENKYLALNDTANFSLFIKSQTEEEKHIYFTSQSGSEQLQFIPAELPDNSCKIIYNPNFITDDTYFLRVKAKDASNNVSGDFDYTISFKIVNHATITDVFNYPNPFSTSTRFVFTLTGSEVPTDLRVQILTVTGKLVKEIDLAELGDIHIGRNITTYAWDGKDMFGDQLANGVYFYRVIAKSNGKDIDKSSTGVEKFFNKGFGKMYLMR